jgi:predicted CXXCH cytochrome family protein
VRTVDATLSVAPGGISCAFDGCHKSLASIRYGAGGEPLLNPIIGNGCIGCHDPAHHADDEQHPLASGSKYVDESGGGYRFLNKAGAKFLDIPPHSAQPAVAGIEDGDWEQSPSASAHNEYQDYPKPGAPGAYGGNPQGISDFCAGCHNTYHSWPAGGSPNGGDGNPWLRHPAGVVIPGEREYNDYTVYDPKAPAARPDAAALSAYPGPSSVVTPGTDKVMCLSCHRAHGSPYPDMLRWDYDTCTAGSGDPAECGCFVCHTLKDE